jgi:hypothetical protein
MVSLTQPGRTRRPALIVALVALVALVASYAIAACSRHADIKDEPDSGTDLGPNAPRPDGGVPLVEDSGLDDPSLTPCADRPENGACRGANDFPCNFAGWVPVLAEECQTETGCSSNGWVELELADDGCATAIYMDQPNAAYVTCLVSKLGAYRCPCEGMSFGHFLGIGNDGCNDAGEPRACQGGEFPCDKGQVCVDGVCVADASGGASG